MNVAPRPIPELSAVTCPPCRSTRCLTTQSPRPTPSGLPAKAEAFDGVSDTEVGYTGGWLENPRYDDTHGSKSEGQHNNCHE